MLRRAIACLLIAQLAAVQTLAQVLPQPQQVINGRVVTERGERDLVAGVYLPSDRAISRAIGRARERLEQHEYQEALSFLHGILARGEDAFIDGAAGDREQLGLKATARKMIGELPAEGISAYELLQGPAARRQLEAALKEGSRDGVATVVRQFFHTAAGYEATFVLAQIEADQGHRLAAAQLYQDLIETPRAAARFEPQLSVAAAVNQLAAGRQDDAAATIRALCEKQPGAEVVLYGKKSTLPGAGGDPLAWLGKFVGQVKRESIVSAAWLTAHGDPSRNVQTAGGQPHLRPRWEARVVNEPSVESYLASRSNDFLQRGVVAVPGGKPIAIGDVIVMRTPDNIVAVDWQTGKRIWETRDEAELETEEAPADLAPGVENDQLPAQGKPLEDRVWDDALATALSSDGARVFVVRGVANAREEESFPWQVGGVFGRPGIEAPVATNQLVAYELATQGKLLWELDGARTTGPLAGAFFLGAPLAIDSTLYVMAEVRSALYLVALDPATGNVEWQQQLVGLEQGVMLDSARRRAGAAPSYSGGILVCPTGASAAVAIDVVKREFAWVYRYAREVQTPAEVQQFWRQQQVQGQLGRTNDQWLDSSAIVAENYVLLTPRESAEIHCLELRTGKLVWKRRQGEALFVGGVDRGNVLLIGSQNVQALQLSDGNPAWKQETVSLPSGVLPAGQGYQSNGQYYLPLTTGQVAQINMATGKFTTDEPPNPDVLLGNLICYRGSIISQSPLLLDKFEQLGELEKRTEAALAKNSDDTEALRELAEIKRGAGETNEAVRLLKRARELAPEDATTQEMLVELMLQQLATDYASHRDDVPLLMKLIRGREQQLELLRIDAAGRDLAGEKSLAWDAYLKLADYTAEEPAFLRNSDRYVVRSDRWIASRLAAIWSAASTEERSSFSQQIATRRPQTKNPSTAAEMRHYLNHLGELPGADDVRIELARFLVDRGRAQEAELELLQLSQSSDVGAAAELLSKLNVRDRERNFDRQVQWPRGRVEAQVLPANVVQNRDRPQRMVVERQTGHRPLRIEQSYGPGDAKIQWYIAVDLSEIVGRNRLGEDVYHLTIDQNNLTKQFRDINLVHGSTLGHLLYVTAGGQIMAIDSRQDAADAEADLLWPARTSDEFSIQAGGSRRVLAPATSRVSRPPVYHAWSGRKRIAGATGNSGITLGPVSPRGIVLQDSDELKCVDPLSGAVLWARSDIPTGCELFGNDELVFAADVGNHVAHVVRISDGELLGQRDVPKDEWLLTAGGNIAQVHFTPNNRNRVILTVTDIDQQQTVFQREFATSMRSIAPVEPNLVAILEPTGEFHLLDVLTGRMLIDQKLEAVRDLQSIQTLQSGDDFFLFASSQVQSDFKPIGQPADFPLVNGKVYAFSLETGEPLWPGPALVRNRGIVLQQPGDIPLLVFADRQLVRDAASGGGSQLRVLCLDKRTGQTVYRNDSLQDGAGRFRVRGETDNRPAVALDTSAGKIQLTLTDRTRPPLPPANDDLEAPRQIAERGMRALGQRGLKALSDALQKPVPAVPPQQRAAPGAKPPGAAVPDKPQPGGRDAQPADVKEPEKDDD